MLEKETSGGDAEESPEESGMPTSPPRQPPRCMLENEEHAEDSEEIAAVALVEIHVPVPKSLIRKVIGKGGKTIATIKKKSNAHEVDARDQTRDPVQVRIMGTLRNVRNAERMIHEVMNGATSVHAETPVMSVPQSKVGAI